MIAPWFDRIRWKAWPVRRVNKGERRRILGLDSEAYTGKGRLVYGMLDYEKGAGQPFMFAVADETGELRKVWRAEDVRQMLVWLSAQHAHIFVFNLRYEVGAILRALKVSEDKLDELRKVRGERWVEVVDGWEVLLYPGKVMKIRRKGRDKRTVIIWDAHNFFPGSLNKVAQDLLGEGKIDEDVSKFTKDYVREHWDEIADYCWRDAYLTAKLMAKLVDTFKRVLGVVPSTFYSPAAWSAQVFRELGAVENVRSYWKHDVGKELLRYASAAYAGGKFEMRVKGTVKEAWEYDLSSAYPAVIAQLRPLRWAKAFKSRVWVSSADYGFLHVIITIDPRKHGDFPHPVGVWGKALRAEGQRRGTLYYPVGRFEAVITKDEYEYLIKNGIDVEVIDAWWIITRSSFELYRDRVERLYKMKESATDPWTRHVVKIVLNGFYGKFVQMIEHSDGSLEPGLLWNPIYGAVITARVRVWLSEIQRRWGDHILAVHTDSVISDMPLPIEGEGLGAWKLKKKGEYLGIRSGVYQLGDKIAHQGFIPPGTWKELLAGVDPRATVIEIEQIEAISWMMAAVMGDANAVNVFVERLKVLNLNEDPKRINAEPATAGRLLQGRLATMPLIAYHSLSLDSGGSE